MEAAYQSVPTLVSLGHCHYYAGGRLPSGRSAHTLFDWYLHLSDLGLFLVGYGLGLITSISVYRKVNVNCSMVPSPEILFESRFFSRLVRTLY